VSGQSAYAHGAGGFDRVFGLSMRQFIPTLLRMARIAPGQKVLDVATGTGLAAEEAVIAVGASGHVTAVDGTFEMLDQARKRLAAYPNAAVENVSAENLMLPSESFDSVICCMALMIFSDRSSAMAGMRRALRTGGRMAASVNTTPERTLTGRVRALIAKYAPSGREAIESQLAHHYELGQRERLLALFREAGLRDIETMIETRSFEFPSFAEYFEPFERGDGPWGARYASLPPDIRKAIRDERCKEIGGKRDGPVSVAVDILYCAGTK
jgi:ubiquinone/menaquinone biosynthesis C-methylase UbiE